MSEGDRFVGMTVAVISDEKPRHVAGPYALGSTHLPGLSKLVEENGEVKVELADYVLGRSLGRVGQVAGKIMGLGHMGDHWDGTNLKCRLEDELADLEAAIEVFKRLNGLDHVRMYARACEKRDLFLKWAGAGQ